MRKRPLLWVFLLTVFGVLICRKLGWLKPAAPPFEEGEQVSLYGTVENIVRKENSRQLWISNVCLSSDISYQRQVLVYENQNIPLKIGYVVKVQGSCHLFSCPSNPGQFDEKSYYDTLGVGFTLKKSSVSVVKKREFFFRQGLFELRQSLSEVLYSVVGKENGGLLCAMLLGDKAALDKEEKELYRIGGISHVFAISGLHISLLGMLLYRILRKWKRSYGCCVLVGGSFMTAYGFLVGWGVSAQRAMIMFFVFLGAELLGRSYDLLSGWSLAGILILIWEPRLLFQCGFQLSFLSVSAIGGVYPRLQKSFLFRGKYWDNILPGWVISLVTLPCTLYWFYEFMPYGLMLNLLVLPLVPVVFLSGALGMTVGCFSLGVGMLLAGPGVGMLEVFRLVLESVEKLPGNCLTLGQPSLISIALYFILLFLGFFMPFPAWLKKSRLQGFFRCILVGTAVGMLLLPKSPGGEITFLDVGQGDGIFLKTPKGTSCFIDGGSSTVSDVGTYRILPFLKAKGVGCVDFWFLTHMDEDHINGVRELLEDGEISIGNLCMVKTSGDEKQEKLVSLAKGAGTKVLWMSRGSCMKESDFSLKCLYPGKEEPSKESNENSMVLLAEWENFRLLFTGDLEGSGEEALVDEGILSQVDVLKVAHHGSGGATGEEFLDLVWPKVSVISVGKDNERTTKMIQT